MFRCTAGELPLDFHYYHHGVSRSFPRRGNWLRNVPSVDLQCIMLQPGEHIIRNNMAPKISGGWAQFTQCNHNVKFKLPIDIRQKQFQEKQRILSISIPTFIDSVLFFSSVHWSAVRWKRINFKHVNLFCYEIFFSVHWSAACWISSQCRYCRLQSSGGEDGNGK